MNIGRCIIILATITMTYRPSKARLLRTETQLANLPARASLPVSRLYATRRPTTTRQRLCGTLYGLTMLHFPTNGWIECFVTCTSRAQVIRDNGPRRRRLTFGDIPRHPAEKHLAREALVLHCPRRKLPIPRACRLADHCNRRADHVDTIRAYTGRQIWTTKNSSLMQSRVLSVDRSANVRSCTVQLLCKILYI